MDNRELILQRLSQHIGELRGFITGVPEAELKRHPSPQKWSLHELAAHLVEVQDVFIERVTRILTEENPPILPFRPDKAREEGSYLNQDLSRRMRDFELQRRNLFALLESLTNEQWGREGRHPEIRHYTVEKCLESLMRHEEHHLHQMFNIFFGIPG